MWALLSYPGMTSQVLTDRQLEAARLAAEGLTFEEAGVRMGVSKYTARLHTTIARQKLGVTSKRHLFVALRERGLL